MTRKVYRTAQGKLVDLGRLQLQNENTRAVGNMGVNARGDKVDSMNRAIDKKPAQVQRQYNRQTTANPESQTVPKAKARVAKPVADIPPPPEDFQDDFVRTDAADNSASPASSGLAAAIARAREIKQEPLRSAADTAKLQEGVHKI